jgi:hypothetical protein
MIFKEQDNLDKDSLNANKASAYWTIAIAAANSAESMILASAAANMAVNNLMDVTETFKSDKDTALFLQNLLQNRKIAAQIVKDNAYSAAMSADNARAKAGQFVTEIVHHNLLQKYKHIYYAIYAADQLFPVMHRAINMNFFEKPSIDPPSRPPPSATLKMQSRPRPNHRSHPSATGNMQPRSRHTPTRLGGTKKSRKRKTNRKKTNRRKTNRRKTN